MAIEQGAIYRHDFGPRSNYLQEGRRPVLVIQTDLLNRIDGYANVIVVPLTTRERPSPTYVRIEPSPENALDRTSWAICNQIFTIDKGDLGEGCGRVSRAEWRAVVAGLRVALGMLDG